MAHQIGYRHFTILKDQILGHGSYGAVYKARCDQLMCAAKILHPTIVDPYDPGSGKILQRFQQECDFLNHIRHPNIVQYLGVCQDPDSNLPVLLMELLDSSLTKMLERSPHPIPYHIQVDLCSDVSLAVAYLHSNGIIHRDLSGNNVLVIAGRKAKVTDFGMSKLAKSEQHLTPLTLCPGTVSYMSPESLKEPPRYTKKLDVFSQGVIMIQVCTREFPNPGPTMKEIEDPRSPTGSMHVPVLEPERRKKHIDLIDLTHPLLPIALGCLEYRERDRPSAEELCQRLAALKESQEYIESSQHTTPTASEVNGTLQQERDELARQVEEKNRETATKDELRVRNLELPLVPGPKPRQMRSTESELDTETNWRDGRSSVTENAAHGHGPPLSPRQSLADDSQRVRERTSATGSGRTYFSKIFNGCPLHLNCAASWTHPVTKLQYVLFGAEEGLFSLLVTNNPDPVMEQVSSRACHWLRVVESALIWLSGNSRFISMTNLILLFQTDLESQKEHSRNKQHQHTAKIPDSKNCMKCCICRNPFTDQRYLLAAVPKGILLMQWFQPHHEFKHVMLFECQVPQPLNMIEAFVQDDEEYPIVCFGVKERSDGSMAFNTMNLNTQASWYTEEKPKGKDIQVLCLQQLEKDTIFIGVDRYARFVDRNGRQKPSSLQASQLTFEKRSEHMVYLSNCVLSFHKHGMQGKSLQTQQVTAEVADSTKIFHVLGSFGTIIIETRPKNDPTSPTNIYILVSEDGSTPHAQ